MNDSNKDYGTPARSLEEKGELRRRLAEAEQTLEAIRQGDVDALVVVGPWGEQIYSLAGAEHVYRVIVETMNEAALTVDPDGTILFCNGRFCDLMKAPVQAVMGHKLTAFVAGPQKTPLRTLLKEAQTGPVQRRLTLQAADGRSVPVQFSANLLEAEDHPSICLVASDLTELETSAHSLRVLREHQQALEESEHRYQELVRCAPAAIYTVDVRRQRFTSVNNAMCRMTGYRREELLAMSPFDLLDGESQARFRTRIDQWLRGGEEPDWSVEYRVKARDGRILDALLGVAFTTDENGKPLQVTVVGYDITERKRAEEALSDANENLQAQTEQLRTANDRLQAKQEELEKAYSDLEMQEQDLWKHAEALRESEQRLALITSGTRIGIYEWNVATGETLWTEQVVRLLGLRVTTAVPQHYHYRDWVERVHPEDLPRAEAVMRRCMAERTPYETEYRVIWPGGSTHWLFDRGVCQCESEGRCTRVLGILMDITERKRAEEALKESEFHLARAQQIAHLGSWSWDLAGNRLYWSDETYRLYGLQPGECVPRHEDFLGFVHPEDRPWVEQRVQESLTRGGAHNLDYRIIQKGGEERYVHCEAQTTFDPEGHPTKAEGAIQDITERKRTEEELKRALQETHRRCAEISALMTCTRAVLECPDLASALRTVFDACRELLGAPNGYVAILTPDGANNDVLFLRADGLCCTVDPSLPMPVRGLRGEAYRTGRVVYENDFAHSPWAKLLPPGHARLENVLFAPIGIDGRTVGLLGLGNKPGGFTDQDATLAATFGELAAIALRNSRTVDSLRELNATLESKVTQRTAELEHRTRQLQKLTLELSQAEERERRHIALILHEDLQQQIAGARFHLGQLEDRAKRESPQEVAQRVDAMLKDAIEKSRRLSHDLSPAVLHMNDLAEVLLWLAKQVWAKYGLTVHVDVLGETTLQSESLTMFLFRAAQEVLLNVVKHARVHEATIRVRRPGPHVCLCISDPGRGFDPQVLKDTAGFGLLGIREHVELLGGRIKIRSFKDRGTAVRIVVPEAPGNGEIARQGAEFEAPHGRKSEIPSTKSETNPKSQ